MDAKDIRQLLDQVSKGTMPVDRALEELKDLPFKDIGVARLDTHRGLRRGYGEVIYCRGKMPEAVKSIVTFYRDRGSRFLATKVSPSLYNVMCQVISDIDYCQEGQIAAWEPGDKDPGVGLVHVVTAGTSDIPVAREAEKTAEFLGSKVESTYDVGVAGIHRIVEEMEQLKKSNVIVVVAGMEGALPSVVSGFVDVPVIAVPTSVGYGANFGGLAPLLSMLNSCSPGVSVVNIDNGFGAGYLANNINRKIVGTD